MTAAGISLLPYGIKAYVEHTHPEVKIGKVSKVRPGSVDFEGVSVVKGDWLKANFDRVTAYRDGHIGVHGGELTYRVHATKEAPSEGGRTLSVHGIRSFHVIGPTYTALLEGVSYTNGILCFDKASATHPKLSGSSEVGCVDKAKNEAWAEKVVTHIDAPLGIPEFPDEGDVVSKGVKVQFGENLRVDAREVHYGPLSAITTTVERKGPETHIQVKELALSHPWLATGPLHLPRGVDLLVHDEALTKTLSPIKATVNGVPLELFVREQAVQAMGTTCEEWANAMPPELRGPLEGIRWQNKSTNGLSFWIMLKGNVGEKPAFKIWHTCRADCSSPALQALRRKFVYQPYDSHNKRFDRESGPGSRDWVPLGAIHHSLPTAAITMEDPGFQFHQGYIAQAFENSLKDNLKFGRFMRGGSTITMQLAKNLWLYRDKTLTRKMQEVLLSIALESCFTKTEIMELYLNVVEYGPDLYGIGPAAQKYFHTDPGGLTPEQAFWLAMLLPHPRKAGVPDEASMKRVKAFMQTLAKNGRIDETLLAPDAPVDDAEWGQ